MSGTRLSAALLLALLVAAGMPVPAAACGPADGCPMAAAGACKPATAACPHGAVWTVALSCCGAPAAAQPAPGAAAISLAAAAGAPPPAGEPVAAAGPLVRPMAPTTAPADRLRAERRHALGLSTLLHTLLN